MTVVMMSRRTLAVDTPRRWAIWAVLRAAHTVEKVRFLALAIEPQLGTLACGHSHRLATCQLDLRSVRGHWAHVPLVAIY